MNTSTIGVFTGVVVLGGVAAQNATESVKRKHPVGYKRAIRATIGISAYLLGLLIFDEIMPGLARAFAVLFLITALLVYAVPISKSLGFLSAK